MATPRLSAAACPRVWSPRPSSLRAQAAAVLPRALSSSSISSSSSSSSSNSDRCLRYVDEEKEMTHEAWRMKHVSGAAGADTAALWRQWRLRAARSSSKRLQRSPLKKATMWECTMCCQAQRWRSKTREQR